MSPRPPLSRAPTGWLAEEPPPGAAARAAAVLAGRSARAGAAASQSERSEVPGEPGDAAAPRLAVRGAELQQPELVREHAQRLGVGEHAVRILLGRGVETIEDQERF